MRANWFIAYPIDAGQWYEPLIRDAPEGLHRVHPDDLHVTFAFLGRIDLETALDAWAIAAGADLPTPEVTLGRIEGFGPGKRPSAFGLTLDSGREAVLDAMNAYQGLMLDAVDMQRETHPPRPHVTVVRTGRRARKELVEATRAWAERRVNVPHTKHCLDRLALYTWSKERGAKEFQIVHQRWLKR